MPGNKFVGAWEHLNTPPPAVLSAFNLQGEPKPLVGGQGESWLVDQVVLKPTHQVELAEFYGRTQDEVLQEQARLLEAGLNEGKLFRLPKPIIVPGSDTAKYVFQGWTATEFIDGAPDPAHRIRIEDILPAARAFHEVLKTTVLTPDPAMHERTDRWAQADRFAWDEMKLSEATNVSEQSVAKLLPSLDRLHALKKSIATADYHSQLVHGDLSGNVLYPTASQPELAIGIIDFAGYWRPAAYAEAVMVADGLIWRGEGRSMIELVGITDFRIQMLIRALIFRIATHCIDVDVGFAERNLPNMDCEHAIGLVEELSEETANMTCGSASDDHHGS